MLQHAGWRYGQGYLFGPPAPATGGHMPRARNPLEMPVG
jgi:EAL domain-containing protein (putative c-di-GMP-specific phosphodiesterase class I)